MIADSGGPGERRVETAEDVHVLLHGLDLVSQGDKRGFFGVCEFSKNKRR